MNLSGTTLKHRSKPRDSLTTSVALPPEKAKVTTFCGPSPRTCASTSQLLRSAEISPAIGTPIKTLTWRTARWMISTGVKAISRPTRTVSMMVSDQCSGTAPTAPTSMAPMAPMEPMEPGETMEPMEPMAQTPPRSSTAPTPPRCTNYEDDAPDTAYSNVQLSEHTSLALQVWTRFRPSSALRWARQGSPYS